MKAYRATIDKRSPSKIDVYHTSIICKNDIYYRLNYQTWEYDQPIGNLRKPIEEEQYLHFFAWERTTVLEKTRNYIKKHFSE